MVAPTDASVTAGAPQELDGTGATTPRSRRFPVAWLGLVPFFGYVGVVFAVPVGFILYNAFRKTVTTTSTQRNPVTQQFVRQTSSFFTGSNFSQSVHGIYRTDLWTSVRLSALTAVVGSILGVLLAYAVVNSRSNLLKQVVTAASAVTANFGGVPLAFLFIATLDPNAGVLSKFLQHHLSFSLQNSLGFRLQDFAGISLVYLYFLIPLMVLVMAPALQGLKPQWGEAAESLGASRWEYWRLVAGPVLLPTFLGSLLLLFCSSFSAYATVYSLNHSFPVVTIAISAVLNGNVLPGQENLGAALAIDMIVIVLPMTVGYQLLQRRTSRWIAQ